MIVADEVPVPEPVQSPQERLTKFFERRPSQHELEQRNILKDTKIAPAIQGAKVLPVGGVDVGGIGEGEVADSRCGDPEVLAREWNCKY